MDKHPVKLKTGEFMEIVNTSPVICGWAEDLTSEILPHYRMAREICYTSKTTINMNITRRYLNFGCFRDFLIYEGYEDDIEKLLKKRY